MKKGALLAVRVALGLVAAGVWVAACGGTGGTGATTGQTGGTGQSGGAGGEGTAGGGGTSGTVGAGASSGSPQGGTGGQAGDPFGGAGGVVVVTDGGTDALEEGCAEVAAKANRIPLHLYIALDRSSSLSGAKWDAARVGLEAFLKDPASAGIDVALVTFPRQPLLNPQECSFANYTDPEVGFGKLPDNTKAILDFLATVKPNGYGTPIYPALGGALERSVLSHQSAPGENFAVLLVTDGEPAMPPETCNGVNALDPVSIGKFVADTFGKYQVRTFVIGLPGISPAFATTLAQQGGTQAILIQQNLDLSQQFQQALATVLGEGLGCEFPLPSDSSKYDTSLVNVRYTPGNGMPPVDLSRSLGCKDGLGWDFDSDTKPTKVVLCGTTCSQVKKDGLAKVDVVLGCPTRIY